MKNNPNIIAFTHADQIEDYTEYLQIRYVHFMMDHPEIDKKEVDAVVKFVDYCVKQNEIDLDVPRGPDKTSFRQRRDKLNETTENQTA